MSTVKTRVPANARWKCHSCGFCCRHYELGPVSEKIVRGINDSNIDEVWPKPPASSWFETRQTPNGPQYFLRKKNGACVFLDPQNRCIVHSQLGEAAKPAFCREFPFRLVKDPKGIVMVARPDCAGFAKNGSAGDLLSDQVEAVAAIPRTQGIAKWNPPAVSIVPNVDVPVQSWMDHEVDLLHLIEQTPGGPSSTVTVVRGFLEDRFALTLPPPDPTRARLASRAALTALEMVMQSVLTQQQTQDPAEHNFAVEMYRMVSTARMRMEKLDSPPPFDAPSNQHLNLLLRSDLLAKRFQSVGGVSEGLGLFLLNTSVVQTTIHHPNDVVAVGNLSTLLSRWVRFSLNRSIRQVLHKAKPALIDIFLHTTDNA